MSAFPAFHTTAFKTEDERMAAAQLSPAERQAMVKNVLYPYPQFEKVSKQVRSFHRPVDGGDADTGWLAGVIGEYRSGKSFILQSFAREFQPRLTDAGFEQEVVYLQARNDWDSFELGRQLYIATGIPTTPRFSTSTLNTKATRRMIECKVKLIIIDDAHTLLGTHNRRRTVFISLIKHLLDQANACNIILVGPQVVADAMHSDLQMMGRGGFPTYRVEGFDMNTRDGRNQFRLFLHGVDERLPFRTMSDLQSKHYFNDLMELTDGSIGLAMNIVKAAAYQAINDNTACILLEHLQAAAEVRVPPGKTYRPFGRGINV